MRKPGACRLDGDASVEEIIRQVICRMIHRLPAHDLPVIARWIVGGGPLFVSRCALCAMVSELPEADRLALLDELLRRAAGRPQ